MTASEHDHDGSANGRGPLLACLAALAIAAVVIFPVAYGMFAANGLLSAGAAFLVAASAAIVSHLIGMIFPGPEVSLMKVGSGFFFRMGIPLLYCFIIISQKGFLFDNKSHFFCCGFYAAVMAAEVLMLAKQQQPISLAKNKADALKKSDGENTAT